MAFTVLIAFGYIPNVPYGLQVLGIFQGQYDDFSSEWYSYTGAYNWEFKPLSDNDANENKNTHNILLHLYL
jgi:hypothetical protein